MVRAGARVRAGAALITALLLLQVQSLVLAPSVSAHCPGGVHEYMWATAQRTYTSNKGAWASLQWANPAVCTPSDGPGFTAEWVTTCDDQCALGYDGWAQVGWVKRTGWSQPKGFCELAASEGGTGFGGPIYLIEFSLYGATYPYEVTEAGGTWWCFVNSITRASRSTTWMGFSYGDIVIAGGETIAPHSTIGVMAPSKFLLNDIRKLKNGTWSIADLNCCDATAFPYAKDEPAAGQLRNWTKAH